MKTERPAAVPPMAIFVEIFHLGGSNSKDDELMKSRARDVANLPYYQGVYVLRTGE